MLNLSFIVSNPWGKTFKNIKESSVRLWANKAAEVQLYVDTYTLLEFDLKWTHKCDHAGLHLSIGLFGIMFSISIYDTRHWNYKLDKWVSYDTN